MYIAFEGIDGAGTTTMSQLVTSYLNGKDVPAVRVVEPSDGKVGKILRKHMNKKPQFSSVDAVTQLFAADRVELGRQIGEYISESRVVISDRCLLSSYVYQGMTLKEEWIREHNKRAPKPDRIIYLSVDPEEAARRVANRDQLEQEDETRLRMTYQELAERYDQYAEAGHIDGCPIIKIENGAVEMAIAEVIVAVDTLLDHRYGRLKGESREITLDSPGDGTGDT